MIAIIDYDAGNIKSVEKAMHLLGQEVVVTRDRESILKADKVILPGVGAFGDAMSKIRQYGLEEVIHEVVEKGTPFLGICLGLQLAVIEFARHVAGIKEATSEEFQSGGELLIHYMEGQSSGGSKGGSMRLGSYECHLEPKSLAHKIYNSDKIGERHRHRLEVNNMYINKLIGAGLVVSGRRNGN
jgi:CTP synthase (UTP-ammonia lyase)